MNRLKNIYCYLLFSVITISSFVACGGGTENVDKDNQPIVTVNDKTLYMSDLLQNLPHGLSTEDSTNFAQSYINGWINDELFYKKAEQNIVDEAEIEELVNNYRRSLIMNSYQQYLLKGELSKKISESDLQGFYDLHKDELKLKENIVKGLFLKVPIESPQLDNFKKWYKQGSDAAVENIEKNSLQNVVGYEFFYDKWIDLNDVMSGIPYRIDDVQSFLKNNKNLEVSDSSFVYLLNIKDYRLTSTVAPYEYAKDKMVNVYLENKKYMFLEEIQKDLYNKALSSGDIKFYKE